MRHGCLHPVGRAEHIMSMPAAHARWTAQEVRRLIAESPLQTPRYELVDSELLVTPSPAVPHQRAVQLLWKALDDYLQQHPAGDAYLSPSDVELETGTIVQPDVYVVPPHEALRIMHELPVRELSVAVEVLSPSSGQHDRVSKRRFYCRHVPEYWIVDLDARIIERWPRYAVQPEVLVEALEWQPATATSPFRLDLPAYFGAVSRERRG
jgi:Uma2 family endonuclease